MQSRAVESFEALRRSVLAGWGLAAAGQELLDAVLAGAERGDYVFYV